MKPIILASQSPRRKEILSFFKLPFIQVSPTFDEDEVKPLSDPIEFAHYLSRMKGLSVQEKHPDEIIISADTIVYQEGEYFAKPKDRAEAVHFLRTFSGKTQKVITSLTLLSPKGVSQDYGLTEVTFNPLTDDQINAFLDTHIWKDKAGGYTILGSSSLLVSHISGCFYNVIGFPVNALERLLKNEGLDLWRAL